MKRSADRFPGFQCRRCISKATHGNCNVPTTALPTDLHTQNQDHTTTLPLKEAHVAADAHDGPVVAAAAQNVAEENKSFFETFWHTLPAKAEKRDRIHKEICNWRANFTILNKKYVGQKFVESFDEILRNFAETAIYEELSFKVTAIFLHLVLTCMKSNNDGLVP